MSSPFPAIPYGRADFEAIRREGCLYVDKTRFLHALEQERYAFLIRPRRFGKSLWAAVLASYYDRNRADRFETIFAGADVGRRPTPNRHRYVVLHFDFSAFDNTLETLRERFETYCFIELRHALERNADLFPEPVRERILAHPSIDAKFRELFLYAGDRGIPLYAIIDEYDNFANTVLAHRGPEAYRWFTHGGGFYRNFFAALKAGAGQAGGLERLFVTGVSPITMDDVTSGFNIGANVSLDPEFHELLGFTEAEVRSLLERYRDLGAFDQGVDAALDVMREWYGGYRFSEEAETVLYNTDMVLYYLKHSASNGRGPRELIDVNVRIDYGKLRHLLVTGRRLNGNFDLLREVIGDEQVESELRGSFPLERLTKRENFLSLLHYFGLLSIRGVTAGTPRLGVPNQTVRQLTYGFLRDAYDDVGVFTVDLHGLERLTRRMAYDGAWRPVLEFLRDAIARQTSIRDYLAGEKVIQGFLAAYLSVTDCFVLHTEKELNGGYADACLEPLLARHPDARYGYVIELKYLKRGAGDAEARIETAAREATAQLRRYLADERLARQYPKARFTGLAVVFHGWEMAPCKAVFIQKGFDDELRRMLAEKREAGNVSCRVISRELHRRVVGGDDPNRMPMACNAMWKLWKEQGSVNGRVVRNETERGQSSTIEIEYDCQGR